MSAHVGSVGDGASARHDAFSIAVGLEGAAAVLTVAGELDMAVQAELVACSDALLPLVANIILDLGAVSFIDSAGLHALLRLRSAVLASGGSITLRHPSEQVERLLELTGSTSIFSGVSD